MSAIVQAERLYTAEYVMDLPVRRVLEERIQVDLSAEVSRLVGPLEPELDYQL
jgi:hypothetical protein